MKRSMESYGGWKETACATLSLFTSAGTLICCALPALFVSLGMGAVFAGIVADVPQLIWISEHKNGVFFVAALLLAAAGAMLWQARRLPCPVDPQRAAACRRLRKISVAIYGISIVLFAIGFFFSYLA